MTIVCDTEKPNLRAASCCSVEVVNGGAGDFFEGRVTMSFTWNKESLHCSRKACASSFSWKRLPNSAFTSIFSPSGPGTSNTAVTRYHDSLTNAFTSRSRSTTKRTATDWTRPADRAGFTLRHNTGESSKPTIRSSTRRACWAFTRFTSMSRGFSIAFRMAVFVISWNTIRLVLSGSKPNTSNKCQEMASPSRSSSDASQTILAFLASVFNSFTNFFLSSGIS